MRGFGGLFLGLDALPQAFDGLGRAAFGIGKDVRMAADELFGDGQHHVTEFKGPAFLRHAGVENDLEKKIAELFAQAVYIAMRDSIGDLVGFLDRVWRDGLERLLKVPRTTAAG